MKNALRDAIIEALDGVHIESGRSDEFEAVVDSIEKAVSKKVLMGEIDVYSEMEKIS